MTQFIALFPVENSLEFSRYDFERMDDESIVGLLKRLENSDKECDSVSIYNASETSSTTTFLNLENFVEDYNNEDYDGGFWIVMFKYSSEKDLLEYLCSTDTDIESEP